METRPEGIAAGIQYQSHGRVLVLMVNGAPGRQDLSEQGAGLKGDLGQLRTVEGRGADLSLLRIGLAEVGLQQSQCGLGNERQVLGIMCEGGRAWGRRLGQFGPRPV